MDAQRVCLRDTPGRVVGGNYPACLYEVYMVGKL